MAFPIIGVAPDDNQTRFALISKARPAILASPSAAIPSPPVSDGLRVSRVRGSESRGNEGIIRRQVKIFQAKGKGSETWRRESVRSYDRKFDSNLPPSLSLSPSTDGSAFFPDPDPINCHRADGNKYSYSSAREEKIQSIPTLLR